MVSAHACGSSGSDFLDIVLFSFGRHFTLRVPSPPRSINGYPAANLMLGVILPWIKMRVTNELLNIDVWLRCNKLQKTNK